LETPNKHHWQEALALVSLIDDEKKLGDCQFDLWKKSYVHGGAKGWPAGAMAPPKATTHTHRYIYSKFCIV
jgi:hypothetical protein